MWHRTVTGVTVLWPWPLLLTDLIIIIINQSQSVITWSVHKFGWAWPQYSMFLWHASQFLQFCLQDGSQCMWMFLTAGHACPLCFASHIILILQLACTWAYFIFMSSPAISCRRHSVLRLFMSDHVLMFVNTISYRLLVGILTKFTTYEQLGTTMNWGQKVRSQGHSKTVYGQISTFSILKAMHSNVKLQDNFSGIGILIDIWPSKTI